MNKIKNNRYLEDRQKIEKYAKYEENKDALRHLSNVKGKKIYDYYKCDYCGDEIRITKKWEERSGGIVILPASLTNNRVLKVALCNKCLKAVMGEFEGEGGK